jgi:hypothetical protein
VPLRRSVPVQRGLPPKRRVPVRKKRSRPRRGPERNPDYLAWIRTLGCLVCGRLPGSVPIEAAHTNVLGPRGMAQKSSDFSAIPLCAAHHRQNSDSYHHLGEEGFEHAHQIQLNELVEALNSLYASQACPIVRATIAITEFASPEHDLSIL